MKHSIRTASLAVAGIFMLGLGFANAADEGRPGLMRGAHASQHAKHDPVAEAQARLEKLAAKLKLSPSQQEAWKTFSAAMVGHARERAQEMEKWAAGTREKLDDQTTPDKMAHMAARMSAGAERMNKLAGETRTFYDQLSPEQKTIFDLYAKNAWHSRIHDRMHDRMH